jgi:hypothetical protein
MGTYRIFCKPGKRRLARLRAVVVVLRSPVVETPADGFSGVVIVPNQPRGPGR